jgi:hypothetical protein
VDSDLELAVLRLSWRLDAIDTWRRETVDPQLVTLNEGLRRMVTAQEIAKAVAHELGERKRLELTWGQKLLALAFAAASLYASLHGAGLF